MCRCSHSGVSEMFRRISWWFWLPIILWKKSLLSWSSNFRTFLVLLLKDFHVVVSVVFIYGARLSAVLQPFLWSVCRVIVVVSVDRQHLTGVTLDTLAVSPPARTECSWNLLQCCSHCSHSGNQTLTDWLETIAPCRPDTSFSFLSDTLSSSDPSFQFATV